MSDKPENPAAFPMQFGISRQYGMTLRDYFAAKAMQSIYDTFWNFNQGAKKGAAQSWAKRYDDETTIDECIALQSYEIADAMLKARGE